MFLWDVLTPIPASWALNLFAAATLTAKSERLSTTSAWRTTNCAEKSSEDTSGVTGEEERHAGHSDLRLKGENILRSQDMARETSEEPLGMKLT